MLTIENFYSAEAERVVIGEILSDGNRIDEILGTIQPDDFFEKENKIIYAEMIAEITKGQIPDIYTLADTLQKKFNQYHESWLTVLATLAKNAISKSTLNVYVDKIIAYAKAREVMTKIRAASSLLNDGDVNVESRIETALTEIYKLFDVKNTGEPKYVKDYTPEFIDRFTAASKSETGITGLSTGFGSIDERTGGLKPGELILIAARPAMGKTTLAINVSTDVAFRQQKNCLLFTIEMTANEIIERMTSAYSDIDFDKIRTARINDKQWDNITDAIKSVCETRLLVDESADITLTQLVARARQAKRKHEIELIIIDHIGLIDVDGESETHKLSKISRQLKTLAKELNIPVIALSQLNRNLSNRIDKRPVLTDLRQSGSLEQDANSVAFIHCDAVYNDDAVYPDLVEVIWGKLRAGRIGTDYFRKEFDRCRFVECDEPKDYGEPKLKPLKSSNVISYKSGCDDETR